jgi:hypothetical protein
MHKIQDSVFVFVFPNFLSNQRDPFVIWLIFCKNFRYPVNCRIRKCDLIFF